MFMRCPKLPRSLKLNIYILIELKFVIVKSIEKMSEIPLAKSAEQLWQQVNQIYFAPIGPGHELEVFLQDLISRQVDDTNVILDKPEMSVRLKEGRGTRRILLAESDDIPQILADLPTPSQLLPDSLESTSGDSERDFLVRELARVRGLLKFPASEVLNAIRSEQRPSRKKFNDLESKLLALYEKKPPSTAVLSAAGAGQGSSTAPTLAALGYAAPGGEDHEELSCSICGDGEGFDNNQILICDGCHFATHQQCYNVPTIPEGAWFCALCKNRAKSSQPITCVLCLQTSQFTAGGLMKPLQGKAGSWAHLRCVNWVPEAFLTPDGSSVVIKHNKDREELRCSLCKCKGGAPIQCSFGKCTVSFHVACASKSGMLDHAELATSRSVLCSKHCKAHLRVSATIGRLLSLRKQEHYIKFLADKWIAPACNKDGAVPTVSAMINTFAKYVVGFAAMSEGQVAFLALTASNPFIEDSLKKGRSLVDGSSKDDEQWIRRGDAGGALYPECGVDVTTEDLRNFQQQLPSGISCCECAGLYKGQAAIWECVDCGLHAHPKCMQRAGSPFLNGGLAIERILDFPALPVPDPALPKNSDITTPFRCSRCEAVAEGTVALRESFCILCMQLGGFLVQIDTSEDSDLSPACIWVHPRCAFWLIPPNLLTLITPVPMQIRSIPGATHFYSCAVCGSRQGCTVKCSRPYCNRRFHVSCGFLNHCHFIVKSAAGLLLGGAHSQEVNEGEVIAAINSDKGGSRRVILCWEHSVKLNKKKGKVGQRPPPRRIDKGRWLPPALEGDDWIENSDDDERKARPSKRKRAGSKQQIDTPESASQLATFHFVNGERVAMEEESWEGCCAACRKPWEIGASDVNSIACDECDQWFHFSCVGIADGTVPEGAFSCPACKSGKE